MFKSFIPVSLGVAFIKIRGSLSKKWKVLLLVIIAASIVVTSGNFWDMFLSAEAVDPNQELQLVLEPRTAIASPASDIYVVNGREYAHINQLIDLMGQHGLLFYKSDTSGTNKGPNGLIARDDIVLIKINEEWPQRGGTNTDVLKELIQAIVNHPDVFIGEIVVVDNGQWQGSMNWPQSNAEDITQSTQDVVDMFSPYYNVSTYTWRAIRGVQVNEYVDGDMTDGYVVYDTPDPQTGLYVSYPKFKTEFGTYISFKYGIWNGTGYENKLKVINLPVLKSHKWYGVTAALKHYMGVQSEGSFVSGGLANGHECVATGGMGVLMIETKVPTLNIIDSIWINANPPPADMAGPSTPYSYATRVNVLLASTDPVALDYWAAKHVLMQAAQLIGYNDTHTLDPDNTDKSGVYTEAFGVWLNRTKNVFLSAGFNVTTDENNMNVYINPEPVHDLAVSNVVTSKPIFNVGEVVDINVTIENQGNCLENFTLTVFYVRKIDPIINETTVILTAYANTTLTFQWIPNATGVYRIFAEVTPVPGEIDTLDNINKTMISVVSNSTSTYYSPPRASYLQNSHFEQGILEISSEQFNSLVR
jgi:hypothetical protein